MQKILSAVGFAAAMSLVIGGCSNGPDDEDFSEICVDYCDRMEQNCTSLSEGPTFDSRDDCLNTCQFYPSRPETLDEATGIAEKGDTVECRFYHAGNAASGGAGAVEHCGHASPDGANMCVDFTESCSLYCGTVVELCVDAEGGFQTVDQCGEACRDFATADVNCRNEILSRASDDPLVCPDVLPDSAECEN